MSFRAMGGHSNKQEDSRRSCIKLVAYKITTQLLAFKLGGQDCWCEKNILLETSSCILKKKLSADCHMTNSGKTDLEGNTVVYFKDFYRQYINRITQTRPSVLSYVTATPCGLH